MYDIDYNSSTYASYASFNSTAALAHYGSASAVAAAAAVAATGANGADGLNSADPNAQIPTGKHFFGHVVTRFFKDSILCLTITLMILSIVGAILTLNTH
jgi:hypothetical protein